jgi:hypothetical protein
LIYASLGSIQSEKNRFTSPISLLLSLAKTKKVYFLGSVSQDL